MSTPHSSSAAAARSVAGLVFEKRKPPVSVTNATYIARAAAGVMVQPSSIARRWINSPVAAAVGSTYRGPAGRSPALTWWSNVVTDAGHHGGGPRSKIARDSFRDADRRLCAFLDHLDGLGVTDDVTFLLTADHGFEGADVTRTGSWRPALAAALDPLGVGWRDEGPGFLYLGV